MNELTRAEEAPPSTMLEMIYRIAVNPSVEPDKMHAILDFQLRVEARDAQKAYNEAFAEMQKLCPAIIKDSKISLGAGKGEIPFATFENVMGQIGPLLKQFNFSYSFTSDETAQGVTMTLTLRHQAGHSESSKMHLPADTGGAKNGVQALGSARSYAKRYLILDMLSIVTVGADDDGAGATKTITVEQYRTIMGLLMDHNIGESEFLTMAGVRSIEELQANRYQGAVAAIRARAAKKAGKS